MWWETGFRTTLRGKHGQVRSRRESSSELVTQTHNDSSGSPPGGLEVCRSGTIPGPGVRKTARTTDRSLSQQLWQSHHFLWFIAYLGRSLDGAIAIRAAVRYPGRSVFLTLCVCRCLLNLNAVSFLKFVGAGGQGRPGETGRRKSNLGSTLAACAPLAILPQVQPHRSTLLPHGPPSGSRVAYRSTYRNTPTQSSANIACRGSCSNPSSNTELDVSSVPGPSDMGRANQPLCVPLFQLSPLTTASLKLQVQGSEEDPDNVQYQATIIRIP